MIPYVAYMGHPQERDILDDPKVLNDLDPGSIGWVQDLLDRCRQDLSMESWPMVAIPPDKEVIIVGDIHGDLPLARAISHRFRISPSRSGSRSLPIILFLGDYLDRPPEDTPQGGLLTALFVIALRLAYPENVIPLRGNHESGDLITFYPYDFPRECRDRFGEDEGPDMEREFLRTFRTFPLMARSDNGLLATHASFPRKKDPNEMTPGDREEIMNVIWGDPVAKGFRGRNMGYEFTEKQLQSFLDKVGCSCMVRGHDPPLQGRPMFKERMMTLVTSRRYEKMGEGGVKIIRVRGGVEIRSVIDLERFDVTIK